MRIFFSILLLFLMSGCAGTPALPPTAGISRIEFVRQLANGHPSALEVGRDGRLYTVEDGQVRILSPDGVIQQVLADRVGGQLVLKSPVDLALSAEFLYVVDQGLNQVVIFTLDGGFYDTFGRKGGKAKEFSRPQGIFFHKGLVYVADTGNDRIQVFGPDGVYLHALDGRGGQQEVPSPQRLRRPRDLLVDPQGNLVVMDDYGVKLYSPAGLFLALLPEEKSPTALALGRDGFFVADRKSYSVRKYDFDQRLLFTFGTRGEGRAQFLSLSALALDSNTGHVFVADKVRGMIQIFLPEAQNGDDRLALALRMPPPPRGALGGDPGQ